MIITKNLHLQDIKRFRVSEGRDLEQGLRLDRNEKVDVWPEDFISKVLASKPKSFFLVLILRFQICIKKLQTSIQLRNHKF